MEFRNWFFEQFPEDTQVNDTYKDVNGEGIWQRYLRTYGLELDNEIMPYIHNFTDIIDYDLCDAKFLPLIATILGNPPAFDSDADKYRKVLAYAVAIYKVKGTKLSFQMFLGILGWRTTIIWSAPAKKLTYDMPNTYDGLPSPQIYDSSCQYCVNYQIGYDPNGEEVTEEMLEAAERVLCFLQPINAKFNGWVRMVGLQDYYTEELTEQFNIQLI